MTLTIKLATVADDGCASRVVTLCCTFSNGRVYRCSKQSGSAVILVEGKIKDIPSASP